MISVLLPIITPLIFMVITGVVPEGHWRRKIALIGFLLHTCVSAFLLWTCRQGVIEIAIIGEWLPPHGIVLLVDLFACFFLFSISLVFLATNLYSLGEVHDQPVHVLRTPLIFILQSGVSLSLLTADFFNLFVSFEMMLAASYALVTLEMPEKYLKWSFSYLIINLMGAMGFLCAAAMIYGYTGHLNMAAIAGIILGQQDNPLILGWAYLLLGIFGLKAGIFPLYFWLPRTYSHLPASLTALFAGSLSKVGVYVLIRMFVVVLPGPLLSLNGVILIISTLTMLLGVLGAIASTTIRGVLSYHIISQIGYMILGLALYTPLAVASALMFIIHNIWVKVSLFLIGGVAQQACESDDLKRMGNLSIMMPFLGAFFLVQAFSLVGFPPLSGFWGKYLLVSESIRLEYYLVAAVALLTSWLTLFSMLKIWIGAFWKKSDNERPIKILEKLKEKYISIGILVFASLILGFGAETVYQKATLASQQIFQKETYIQAIFSKTTGKGT